MIINLISLYFYIYNMRNLKSYEEFIIEGNIANFTSNLKINVSLNGSDHFYDRLSRSDNMPDDNGSIVIEPSEVENDIKIGLKQILNKHFFNVGLYWNEEYLNKYILLKNNKTFLNIIFKIYKVKQNNDYIYNINITTIMRKKDFTISEKEIKNTLIIYI